MLGGPGGAARHARPRRRTRARSQGRARSRGASPGRPGRASRRCRVGPHRAVAQAGRVRAAGGPADESLRRRTTATCWSCSRPTRRRRCLPRACTRTPTASSRHWKAWSSSSGASSSMSLSGNLEDVSVADALQFIHLGGRTGTLTLTLGETRAEIGFHQGRIVNAWGPGSKRLGELLVDESVIDQATLVGHGRAHGRARADGPATSSGGRARAHPAPVARARRPRPPPRPIRWASGCASRSSRPTGSSPRSLRRRCPPPRPPWCG